MKRLTAILLLLLTGFALGSCKGYLFIGAGWQDTPEAALQVAAEDDPFDSERLTVSELLDTFYIDDRAYMLYVSESETLMEADFVKNKKGQFHNSGWSEWGLPEDPVCAVLCGDADQLLSYGQYGSQVWGYKDSTIEITVNGLTPKTKTYVFTCRGKEWSIDRFWVDGIEEDAEVNIECISK